MIQFCDIAQDYSIYLEEFEKNVAERILRQIVPSVGKFDSFFTKALVAFAKIEESAELLLNMIHDGEDIINNKLYCKLIYKCTFLIHMYEITHSFIFEKRVVKIRNKGKLAVLPCHHFVRKFNAVF